MQTKVGFKELIENFFQSLSFKSLMINRMTKSLFEKRMKQFELKSLNVMNHKIEK